MSEQPDPDTQKERIGGSEGRNSRARTAFAIALVLFLLWTGFLVWLAIDAS